MARCTSVGATYQVERLRLDESAHEGVGAQVSLAEDEVTDLITAKVVKLKGNEEVRQRIALALFHEYGISILDMERDFPIPVYTDGVRRTTKKADIAIFEHGATHTLESLRRVVICKPEPKGGRVTKVRTFEQAGKDLDELTTLLGTEATPKAEYGMWTNGIDFFFLHKEVGRFSATFTPRADWPLPDESAEGGTITSVARLRRGEAGMLKTAFRRCHNYIHGNEGMPKDAAFWQFLYLLFCKMHDERVSLRTRRQPEFYTTPAEPFSDDGRKAIRKRIETLFSEVKDAYPLFTARDELTLSDRALAFIVGELAPYNLTGTKADVKGIAYQELVGGNLRGDRGQYFTPRAAVSLMVDILDPKETDTVFDPACGTGGFLRETLGHLLKQWRDEEHTGGRSDTREQLIEYQDRLDAYAKKHLFGADFDPFLVRAASMSVMMLTGDKGNVYYMDSLAFPHGHLSGVDEASKRIPLNSVDIVMTNPPFGTDIKIEDPVVLDSYRGANGVASSWSRSKETGLPVASENLVSSMAPEQLFIQRAVQWVRPGGKIGIVLPNGILSNPGPTDEAIRRWILRNCWVLASIELPVETFIHEAGVNILTSLLFLKRKTGDETQREAIAGAQPDYPVFMAVAEKVGIDRRGNTVYKRRPDGEPILEFQKETGQIRVPGVDLTNQVRRLTRVVDNDLPEIAKAYKAFRGKHAEPGIAR
jgi:type I restriction enzyme M protein